MDEAAHYFRKNLERMEQDQVSVVHSDCGSEPICSLPLSKVAEIAQYELILFWGPSVYDVRVWNGLVHAV
jgi:hypothetical protein